MAGKRNIAAKVSKRSGPPTRRRTRTGIDASVTMKKTNSRWAEMRMRSKSPVHGRRNAQR
jgi:hypothetical protein